MLADGMDFEDIHEDLPFIEPEDVREALRYAAAIAKRDFYLAGPA
ncbi:MAG: DUF433 domain-containing protein [Acidimicrobiaceae bacterium]|nr:DUF433 domain-containing protein [Acidimicrobiaceae bacterium]